MLIVDSLISIFDVYYLVLLEFLHKYLEIILDNIIILICYICLLSLLPGEYSYMEPLLAFCDAICKIC